MRKFIETGMMVLCCAGFFGFVYPELCLTSDTVIIVESEEAEDELKISDLYNLNPAVPPEQIRFRSRIWEIITKRG